MNRLYCLWLGVIVLINFSEGFYDGRVRIRTQDGHLQLMVPDDRNISLLTGRNGRILFNGEDIGFAYQTVRNVSLELASLRQGEIASLQTRQLELLARLDGDTGDNLNDRLNLLEQALANLTSLSGPSSENTPAGSTNLRRLRRRVQTVERNLQRLTTSLETNDCANLPCKNGATCIDSYNNFQCLCTSNWEGPTCEIDVDECAGFRGTELGCQNGATCLNSAGSYRCTCPPGWFGVHCTQRTDGCNSGTNEQMCGHGVCISQPGQGRGYICFCEQGWTTDGVNPACTVDVDECNYAIPLCSVNPRVQCINLPGSFSCGPCPSGYTGNGHYCTDIDECQINNGGCSINPRVQCTNTIGSRSCGPCPPGYQGDGIYCSFVGACSVNNGGCHPSAFCYDNPAISSSYVSCQCRPGFTGNGFGQMGCVPFGSGGGSSGGAVGPVSFNDPCTPNPCVFGTCSTVGNGFQCTCQPGYAGQLCNIPLDPCMNSPCRNGATCAIVGPNRQFRCICPAGFTGNECQNEIQACGGVYTAPNGTITFPSSDGGLYPHQISCAWLITTASDKVMNVTFTRFHLENSLDCKFDWVQIHDGGDTSARLIGRYCGDQTFPGGSLITAHNQLYLWFRSDHSVNGLGFELVWNTIDPVCGGVISATTHGTINSPGYPGRYPPNRDCIWLLQAPLGKRIQFTFATLQLEHHDNCSFDFLEVRDGSGLTDPSLGKFCSTANPPPLTTSGPYALVYFHSDVGLSDNGFHITYAVINGIPGCGGLLTGPGGSLSSPNHPDTYENNLDCEWVIRGTPNERIRLTFSVLALETSRNCLFDYIEVREGGEPQGPLIGRYCNRNTLPLPILSQGNQLFVRFRSDYSIGATGFRARYETVCGGTLTESSGLVVSPNFPSPYPASKQCVYIIALDPGKAVQLNFLDFDIEGSVGCRYDFVEIRDGDNANSTLLGRYCGSPSEIPPPILSTHNYLWIKFQTDSSVHNLGFQANYSSVDVGCGGILTRPQGVIASPLHPEVYPHGTTCRWIVRAGQGKVVRLQWMSFALEPAPPSCRFDSVSVYDNSTVPNTGGLVGRYCGTTLPPSITSTGDTLTIVFKSDASLAAEGFTATYITLNSSSLCGGSYFTETGMISSPGFPNGYQPSLDCAWIIRAPLNRQIQLNITDFDIETHTQCRMDYLEIRNGGGPTSPLIGTFCGRNIPRTIPSHSHEMYIRLVTDYSLSGRGFRIYWDATSTGCGGVLTSPEGSIVSPGYPSTYGENAECIWRIEVSHGSRVLFAFVDLDMENQPHGCAYDYVEVRHGRDRTNRGQLIGRYCNSFSLVPIISKSNSLYVKFKSDMNLAGRGFKARYETLCNLELRGLSGVIESPNFPNVYPHNRNCTWTIVAPLGNRISLTFSHFDVEQHYASNSSTGACLYDFVEIKQPNATLGRFCGSSLPAEVGSTQDQVTVQFLSDMSVAHNGFRLEWRVVGCGGRMAKPNGRLTSPGYPSPYPLATDCIWEIETEPGSRVELTIKDFDIEFGGRCAFDFLRVRGGADETSPILINLCHRQDKPVVVTATGNRMYVHFHSDFSIPGKGFQASFTTLPQGCGGYQKSPVGSIHSPNYPQQYDHDADCGWLIEVPDNHVVKLTFTDFDVEPFTNCTFDYVAVYDGPSLDDPEIGRFCGNTVPDPPVIRSTSNKMFVRLKADGSVSARGFVANYALDCGARITVNEDSGVLTSPNFPYSYGSGPNCTWILTASDPNDRVYLMFTHMDVHGVAPQSAAITAGQVNCTTSFVRVLDGDDSDAPAVGTYCLTRVPHPITSQGSSLYVHMQTALSLGVGFRATYSLLSQGCGGAFTSEHGSFSSPSYPNSYPLSTECIWTITASPGNRVTVSFRMFNLQGTEYCNGDYLEIRANDGGGELLGHFCGSNSLPSNITAANKLWIKFRSDAETTAPGFIADYSLLHGNELTGNRGEIASPLFPFPYIHRDDFSWRVTVDSERYVRLFFFNQFSIERDPDSGACVSSLLVYDGYDEQAPLLGEYCGEMRPRQRYATASGNVVYIVFRSRYSREGSFFKVRWDAMMTRSSTGMMTPSPMNSSVVCGGEYFVTDGNFTMVTSPGFPTGYANNLACTWDLTADPHYRIAMTLITLDMEAGTCLYDRVDIYNGGDVRPRRLGRYCRRDQQGLVVTSAANTAQIQFTTDSSDSRTGFQINAKAVCGGIIQESRGVIKSPKYPSNYPASTTCEWDVRVRAGRTISVRFDNMQIASDPPACSQDYVILRNGDSVDSPVLGSGRLCGNSVPTSPIVTTGNRLHVKFVSDSQTNSAGFQLRFQEVGTSCGGRLMLNNDVNEATIESPNRPAPSPPNAECEWIILVPSGHAVQMDFVGQLDIPSQFGCNTAGVQIHDGGTPSAPELGRYCGSNLPGSIFSRGNSLYVRYFNSVQNPGAGFQARISIARCGGTIVGARGLVVSPNYPSSYEPNSRCVWSIRGPVGHYLNLRFTNLDLPPANAFGGNCSAVDYVQIRERNATNEILATVCGNSFTDVISSYSNEVDVIFQTGSRAYNRQGFRITYNSSVDVCGGDVSGPSGVIQSPGYPNAYPHSRVCIWKIRGPPGRRITLSFTDFALEEPRRRSGNELECQDFVYTANGPDLQSPPLYRNSSYRCGSTLPETVSSSGRSMILIFRMDGSVTHRGFSARYETDQPAVCGGELSISGGSSGYLTSPGLISPTSGNYSHSLFCEWQLVNPESTNTSTVFKIDMMDIEGPMEPSGVCAFDSLTFFGGSSQMLLGQYCGNRTSGTSIFNPFSEGLIRFKTDATEAGIGFNTSYKVSPCGGDITSPQTLTSPNFPAYYGLNVDCIWFIDLSENGQQVQVTFDELQLDSSDCTQDYLRILNGHRPGSPELGRYCGSTRPNVIRSQGSYLWIHFHSDNISGNSRGVSFTVDAVTSGCGGIMHSRTGLLASPNYPSNYGANAECEWEIRVEPGYKVVANFFQRFDLENSTNCQNDFVQLFDWRNETWNTLGRFCGKQFPPTIVSSGETMKVVFRSNDLHQGDGFRMRWGVTCGGVFDSPTGQITSPNYPQPYGDNVVCNYTIIAAPDTYIIAHFIDRFQIEPHTLCAYDRLTAYQGNSSAAAPLGRYCGTQLPTPIVSRSTLFLQFRSDGSVRGAGFKLNYTTQECGGRITTPTTISSPAHPDTYYNNLNCTWRIEAPPDQVVDIKLQSLTMEAHRDCRHDWLAAFEGLQLNQSQLLGRFCGNFSHQLPRLKSRGSQALLQFRTDWSVSHGGFSASVRFTAGERQGCGGLVNLTENPQQQLRAPDVAVTPRNGQIDGELNCQWTVLAPPGKVIRLQLTQIDMMDSGCSEDYLEVRDGAGKSASLVGQYCGSTVPPSLISSNNIMWLQLVTGTSNRRANFVATLSYQETPCGSTGIVQAIETKQTLSSPNYPAAPGTNLRCRWLIDGNSSAVQIHFQHISIGSTDSAQQCTQDRLEVQDVVNAGTSQEANGNLVVNGDGGEIVRLNQHRLLIQRELGQRLTFCGSRLPHDIISSGGALAVTLITGSSTGSSGGFQLQYSLASCNRSYEGIEGRIVSPRWPGLFRPNDFCEFTIESPANTTIAVYFNLFRLMNSVNCTASSLEIRDGGTSGDRLLGSLCGSALPNSIYSSGNRLWLRFRASRLPQRGYDLTYTSTDQGAGCGGTVFNTRGSVTSPGYPGNVSRTTDCQWELTVPLGMLIQIDFPVFQFGPADECSNNYVEISDIRQSATGGTGELWRARYCGNDRPSTYLGISNGATLRYVTSVNNTGSGWRAVFQAVTSIPSNQ